MFVDTNINFCYIDKKKGVHFMKEKQNSENTKLTTLRIPIETYSKIEKLAEKNERNMSQQIRYMLEKYLQMISD